jgi:hypothetical protein
MSSLGKAENSPLQSPCIDNVCILNKMMQELEGWVLDFRSKCFLAEAPFRLSLLPS